MSGRSRRAQEAADPDSKYSSDESGDPLDLDSGFDFANGPDYNYISDDLSDVAEEDEEEDCNYGQDQYHLDDDYGQAAYNYASDSSVGGGASPKYTNTYAEIRRRGPRKVLGHITTELKERVPRLPRPHLPGAGFFRDSSFFGVGVLSSFVSIVILALLLSGALTLATQGLQHLHGEPSLESSAAFDLAKVPAVHRHLVESLDAFHLNPDLDDTLNDNIVTLLNLRKRLLKYPENLRQEVENLLAKTITISTQYKILQTDVTHALNATTRGSSKLVDKIREYQDKTDVPSPSSSTPFLKDFAEPTGTTPTGLQTQFLLKIFSFLRSKVLPGRFQYHFNYYYRNSPEDSLRKAINSYFYQTRQTVDAALKSAKTLSQSVEQSTEQLLRVSKQEKEEAALVRDTDGGWTLSGTGATRRSRAAAVQYFDGLVEEIMVRLGARNPEVRKKELYSILKLFQSLGGLSREVEGKLEEVGRELAGVGFVQKDHLALLKSSNPGAVRELGKVFEGMKEGLDQGWQEWEGLRRRFDRDL
ncbi:hypothetical protein QBC42DRAFT_316349 [Cladorrhinum samala]|uniref:Uncharacterized protein n=1 Tax=Cladorrhinum samala TaxID=585594 RepID=A0AAV9HYJ0_9PEZI|nr:hypothetical protein QBC42DRAFT_316349 [Cladorrhinum samala]